MANKKLTEEQIEELIKEYDEGFGESPANLSKKWGVHPTTVRRYLRENGKSSPRQSHRVLLGEREKVLMRKILVNFRVNNLDKLISELDKYFEFTEREREDEDFIIIEV